MQAFRGFSLTYFINCLITHLMIFVPTTIMTYSSSSAGALFILEPMPENLCSSSHKATLPLLLSVAIKHMMQTASPTHSNEDKLHNLWRQNYPKNLVLPLFPFTRASHSLWASIRNWRWGQGRWWGGGEFPALWTKWGWGRCHHIGDQHPQLCGVTRGSAAAQPGARPT